MQEAKGKTYLLQGMNGVATCYRDYKEADSTAPPLWLFSLLSPFSTARNFRLILLIITLSFPLIFKNLLLVNIQFKCVQLVLFSALLEF